MLASQAEGRGGCGPSYTSHTPVACLHSGILLCLQGSPYTLCPGSPDRSRRDVGKAWATHWPLLVESALQEQAHAQPCLASTPRGAFPEQTPIPAQGQVPAGAGPQTVKTCWRCRAQEPTSRTPRSHDQPSRDAPKLPKCPGLADSREMISLPRNTGGGRPLHSECRSDPPQVESVPGCEHPHWTG